MSDRRFTWSHWLGAGIAAVILYAIGFISGVGSGVYYVVHEQMHWVETKDFYSGCMILPKHDE